MNGRIYDPLLGRFLSADVTVQFPGDLQSYNRYSYVQNNPLRYVDPTGFLVGTPPSIAPFVQPVPPLVAPVPAPVPGPVIITAALHATTLTVQEVIIAADEAVKMGDQLTSQKESEQRTQEMEKSGFPVSPDEFTHRRQQTPNRPNQNPGHKTPNEKRLKPNEIVSSDGDKVPNDPPSKEKDKGTSDDKPTTDEPKTDDTTTSTGSGTDAAEEATGADESTETYKEKTREKRDDNMGGEDSDLYRGKRPKDGDQREKIRREKEKEKEGDGRGGHENELPKKRKHGYGKDQDDE